MIPVYFAPLQGYTDFLYRKLHCQQVGGVAAYYTPFVRLQSDGSLRNKDQRDLLPQNNDGIPVVPQIIARDADELDLLCNHLHGMGWRHIDLNMGCPFPLQTHSGRGCGLLPYPEKVAALMHAIESKSDMTFSVKMRLGLESAHEWEALMPVLNQAPLNHITLHPRIGKQQYKGEVDREAFGRFAEKCQHPLIYNGDITDADQIEALEREFPTLAGVMVGRGLLRNPLLALEYTTGQRFDNARRWQAVANLHDGILAYAETELQGEQQQLSRMQAFWEIFQGLLSKKTYKMLTRCGNMRNYKEGYAAFSRECL